MSVCNSIKGYARRHTWLADIFALMAAGLFFASLFLGFVHHALVFGWISQDLLIRIPIGAAGLALDVFLIFLFLNLGSARLAGEDEGCFATFKGRRAGQGSVGALFTSWLRHMEHVGRKHR